MSGRKRGKKRNRSFVDDIVAMTEMTDCDEEDERHPAWVLDMMLRMEFSKEDASGLVGTYLTTHVERAKQYWAEHRQTIRARERSVRRQDEKISSVSRTQCVSCKVFHRLILDSAAGDVVCTACGFVNMQKLVDDGASRRTFSDQPDENHHDVSKHDNLTTHVFRTTTDSKAMNRRMQAAEATTRSEKNREGCDDRKTLPNTRNVHKRKAASLLSDEKGHLPQLVSNLALQMFAAIRDTLEYMTAPSMKFTCGKAPRKAKSTRPCRWWVAVCVVAAEQVLVSDGTLLLSIQQQDRLWAQRTKEETARRRAAETQKKAMKKLRVLATPKQRKRVSSMNFMVIE